jgi:hypothetical protein
LIERGTPSPHPAAPICENCQRIVAPKVYAVTLHVDDGLIGQRRLCRACLTHVTDRLREAAPWLDTTLAGR